MTTDLSAFGAELQASYKRSLYLTRAFLFCSVAVNVAALLLLAALLPLKEVKPFIVSVNGDGEVRQMVRVIEDDLTSPERLKNREIYYYVINRETYDTFSNKDRMDTIREMSQGKALNSLVSLWSDPELNEKHPDNIFGKKGLISSVKVTGITFPSDNVAIALFDQEILDTSGRTEIRKYQATLEFDFDQNRVVDIAKVRTNPFGFYVSNYRLDQLGS